MAFGPESCILISADGTPLGTTANPLFVAPAGVSPNLPAGHHETPDSILFIDTTGAPLATQTNILQFTALN